MQESWNFLKHFILSLAHQIPISLTLSRNFRDSNVISYITEGILVHGLHFYIAKEFLSSLQFFFSRRVIAVPSLEEIYPRQREATLGKSNESRDKEEEWNGVRFGGRKCPKRSEMWLGLWTWWILKALRNYYLVWVWIRGMGIREEKKDFAIFLKT